MNTHTYLYNIYVIKNQQFNDIKFQSDTNDIQLSSRIVKILDNTGYWVLFGYPMPNYIHYTIDYDTHISPLITYEKFNST